MPETRKALNRAWADYKSIFDRRLAWWDRAAPVLQMRDSCQSEFPDPLDIQDDGYRSVKLHMINGLYNFTIIASISMCCYPLQKIEIVRLLTPANLHLWVLRILLSLDFAWRAARLGYADFDHFHRFKDPSWRVSRSLPILALILAPAWFWYSLFQSMYDNFDSERIPSWLIDNLSWLYLVGSSMRSGHLDVSLFADVWFANRTNSTNSTTTLTQWDYVKESVAFGFSHVLVKEPSALILLITAVVAALYQIVKTVVAAIVLSTSWAPKALLICENSAVRYRDVFVQVLLRIPLLLPLKASSFGRHASTSGRYLTIVLKASALIVFTMFRLTLMLLIRTFAARFLISGRPTTAPGQPQISKFRLLAVRPSLFGAERIDSYLFECQLETPPAYTAISYVWGSSELTSTIFLNGKIHKTTASAEQALQQLRSRWRARLFWIDAICIDQSSVEDKADQISRMAEIYGRAKRVVVWLGHDQDARHAFALARRLLIGSARLPFTSDPLKHTEHAPDRAWRALHRLLRNPWFERSWVIQEALHDDVLMQYGDHTMQWTQFSNFAMAIGSENGVIEKLGNFGEAPPDSSTTRLTARTSRQCINHVRVFEDFRSVYQKSSDQQHLSVLFYLIRMFRSDSKFRATKPRDRVYSLVNLCGLASHPHFRSDYKIPESGTLTTSELFVLVAQHLLCSGPEKGRLDFLFHAGIGGVDDPNTALSVPSWVPDWSLEDYPCLPLIGQDGTGELLRSSVLETILQNVADVKMYGISSGENYHQHTPQRPKVLSQLKQNAKHVRDKTLYRATAATLPLFRLLRDPINTLELQGKYLDRVEKLGYVFPRITIDSASSQSTLDSRLGPLAEVIVQWSQFCSSSQSQKTYDFFRILIGDLSYPACDFTTLDSQFPTRPASLEKIRQVMLYVLYLSTLLDRSSRFWNLQYYIKITDLLDKAFLSEELRKKSILNTHAHVQAVCAGRRIGRTESGFVGLFPSGTRAHSDNQMRSHVNVGTNSSQPTDGDRDTDDEGDQVCLFFGADTPFVVRRCPHESSHPDQEQEAIDERDSTNSDTSSQRDDDAQSYYQLVGPAYLHGFMDGEGLGYMFPTTTFRLR